MRAIDLNGFFNTMSFITFIKVTKKNDQNHVKCIVLYTSHFIQQVWIPANWPQRIILQSQLTGIRDTCPSLESKKITLN